MNTKGKKIIGAAFLAVVMLLVLAFAVPGLIASPSGESGPPGETFIGQAAYCPGISIDIKPGVLPNDINLGSTGTVTVAVLSSATFSASMIDPSTVLFAGAPAVPDSWRMKDVNGDDVPDLVLDFNIRDLAELNENSTEGTLVGQCESGECLWVVGTDSVQIVD